MTNIQWITNHSLSEVIADLCDTAMSDFSKEADIKIQATKWLFQERTEKCTTTKKSKIPETTT